MRMQAVLPCCKAIRGSSRMLRPTRMWRVSLPPAAVDSRVDLSGIVVLDLSRILAGPYASQLLADLGATVWKVEPPHGDDTRTWGPPFADEAADLPSGSGREPDSAVQIGSADLPSGSGREPRSAYFLSTNRHKRSVCVDL
ncbi:MAG: CoA transferase, partial [Trueperaceae bacterium]|nr:CoA transferase [Trueperaceae bacterium]